MFYSPYKLVGTFHYFITLIIRKLDFLSLAMYLIVHMGNPNLWPLCTHFLVFFKPTKQQINVKNVNPVYGAGI